MKTKFFIQILLSFFILAIGIFAIYEYRRSEMQEKKTEELSSFLLGFELKELQSFRIIQSERELSVLLKDGEWVLKRPVKDLASFTEISRWFSELKNQKVQKIKSKDIVWKDYYLEKSPSVEMNFSSGKTISFSVSNQSSFDGKYFIRQGEELFIGESYFHSEVNDKDFSSFRNQRIMPSLGHAKKITFQTKKPWTLSWKNHKWSLTTDKSFPLNSIRLDGFWTDINSIKALSIKEKISPSSLKKYGLDKPALKILFEYSYGDQKYLLKVSPIKKDKAFVAVSHRNFILEISKESAEKILLSLEDIRKVPESKTKKKKKSN